MAFAIRCMHCMEWTEFKNDLDRVSYNSLSTLQGALNDTEIRCDQPSHVCVAPFRAAIYKGKAEDIETFQLNNSWASRIHALYKNQDEKIPGYVVIQFCNQPVMRYRHIELDNLFDNTLLRYALRGLSYYMKGVVSIYAASVYETEGDDDKVCWLPIEPVDYEPAKLIPEGFNPYCTAVRRAIYDFLQIRLSYEDWRPDTCNDRWKIRCATKHASQNPCIRKDWTHCPRLLDEIRNFYCCYMLDRNIIDKIRHKWTQESKAPITQYECKFSKFTEIAIPIIVHNHLVGVIFHGQLFKNANDLDKLPDNLPILIEQLKVDKSALEQACNSPSSNSELQTPEAYRRRITALESLQRKAENWLANAINKLNSPPGGTSPSFQIGNNLQKKKDLLQICASELSRAAEARYRDMRFRAELFFKRELLHNVRMAKDLTELSDIMQKVLARMADFWAFDKGVVLRIDKKSGTTERTCYKSVFVCQYETSEFTGDLLKKIDNALKELKPDFPEIPKVIGLHPNATSYTVNMEKILNSMSLIKLGDNDDLGMLIRERDIIIATVQCVSFHLFFILIGRNNRDKVSPLRPKNPEKGGFSKLFENFFLDTCTDIAREYHNQCTVLKKQEKRKPAQAKPVYKTGNTNEMPPDQSVVKREKRQAR